MSDIQQLGLAAVASSWLRQKRVPVFEEKGTLRVHRRELESVLVQMRDGRAPLRTGDGRTQHLSHFLIVAFTNQFHTERATNSFVATWVRQGQIADFLGARDQFFKAATVSGSIFKRRELRNSDREFYRITTHQFRHWLSTLAKRGGISDVELARWMGRKRIADNRAYDHRTQEERVEEARELIRSGHAIGPLADTYRSLEPVEAEAFVQAQVGSALTTPYGMCVHDYGQGPCERHFSCAGCGELLRKKGDLQEPEALTTMLERTRHSLVIAKGEDDGGTYGASNWVATNERLVIDLVTMLAVDADEAHADNDLVRVWPKNARKQSGDAA